MQQQKLNVVNTISLKGVSSRYMTSRIYHPYKKKCYIFVGTNQMIYFLSIKKDGGEYHKEQESQVYKLQELKKIDQNENVFTCLSTMIYKDEVVVLTGFVNKQTFQSQIYAYYLNSNLVYHNGNLFNESKINLINMRQVNYSKIQFLFTSSSDNSIRIFRFVEPKSKKYQFELQFIHIYKFDEFIIDFDMKCILQTEICVFSHELGNNKVFSDTNEGIEHKLQEDQQTDIENQLEESSKTLQEFKIQHQSSSEFANKTKTSGEIQSQQVLEDQRANSHNHLKFPSIGDYNSSNNLDLNTQQMEMNLPQIDKLKKTPTTDSRDNNISEQQLKQFFQKKQKSLTVKISNEHQKHIQFNQEEIIEEFSGENSTITTKKHSQDNIDGELRKDDINSNNQMNNKQKREIASTFSYQNKPLMNELKLMHNPLSMQNSVNFTQNHLKLPNLNSAKSEASLVNIKQDEMYISFIDIDGQVIVKKLYINPFGLELSQSFQKSVTQSQANLGIAGSYCRFLKCMDNQYDNFQESSSSAQLLSKKQQKKQVKFQQKRQQQQMNQDKNELQNQYDDYEDKQIKDNQSIQSLQTIQQIDEQGNERLDKALRDVNLNLIVTNLMGDIIEFKNVPLQGLDNPIAFPSFDNYNSGVTGLCIKSQDTLEILVSYFDGSVIFFDLNNEDQWNLKLSQPLNSNHFGVYYENTTESDIVFLISDDTIQIYELNSYHIN
ncbi:hypothetical protein TTHERM_00535180 (macronuclear) [Tetrahymena thermophila SB210]|uniref:Uncharacterized protein n=1 Tax=Tetrahymena thermophila (strain SB210) TaxID=312017 RepID=I7M3H9_TETTS|nr:hypothetical protein TTHERM_00535180 [Tetrahymena thermophila SB210]EAS03182.2 hypothetical protein TTHERM_00535180 [Tetrahymena thermophila SB210]|eukprot:XP_001023427.2 hypothetical protein TTHERM_00535180 [Tetrahymena thermophila SB210]